MCLCEGARENERETKRRQPERTFEWRWLYFKKVSSQMRNRILGRRSLTEGREDGMKKGGESERQTEREGVGDWVAQ